MKAYSFPGLSLVLPLYADANLKLINTCAACPEQYDVIDRSTEQVIGYIRLRHGRFRVWTVRENSELGRLVYTDELEHGLGIFDSSAERIHYLTAALDALCKAAK